MLPNLLDLALGAIGTQSVVWKQFAGRTQNDRGQWITTYTDQTIVGSFQPVESRTIKDLGLDTAKHYHNLFTSHPVDNVNRGESPDLIVAEGKRWEVVGNTDWYLKNGWRGILCVEVGHEPESP